MTNQEAIKHLKIWANANEKALNNPHISELLSAEIKVDVEAMKMAIAALEKQEREKWRPINPDDPDSFPDNDRFVLVSFSNLEVVDIARWRTDTEGGMFCHLDEDYSYSRYGMLVNAWKELPKGWTDGSDQ